MTIQNTDIHLPICYSYTESYQYNVSVSLHLYFTADQSSKYHFSFHDEMTLSSHLALSDGDSDFEIMRTQLCLEGTADYETINILTVSRRVSRQLYHIITD